MIEKLKLFLRRFVGSDTKIIVKKEVNEKVFRVEIDLKYKDFDFGEFFKEKKSPLYLYNYIYNKYISYIAKGQLESAELMKSLMSDLIVRGESAGFDINLFK